MTKRNVFVKFWGIRPITFCVTRRYVNFNLSFGRGMRFYHSDWIKIYQKCVNYHIAPLYEILNDSIENFWRYSEKSWFYVDFNHSFGQGMLFYQSDQSKIYQKYRNHHSAPLCEILNHSIKNFLRYIETSWLYVDFNHSFGRGISSTKAINLIFGRNRAFIIIHHPAKFH